ncbi:N-acetylmuramoyl-L-alanine amidase [Candidatus Pacearchaeota archaeon]|nr:N-acetylmuramoyl-L-alanine amidase [Candidatus Pacearchaeota archaeon]
MISLKKVLVLATAIISLVLLPNEINKEKSNKKYLSEIQESQPVKRDYDLFILDPGHGGIDSGATQKRVREDEINYDVVVRLNRILTDKGYLVHQTVYDSTTKFEPQEKLRRGNDEGLVDKEKNFLPLTKRMLYERAEIINSFSDKNPLLVSVHTNSTREEVSGTSIYYPSQIIYDKKEWEDNSKKLAIEIEKSFEKNKIPLYSMGFLGFEFPLERIRDIIRDDENFKIVIFKKTNLETKILIECGNLKNPDDFLRLKDPKERQKIADAIAEGLINYTNNSKI